MRKEEGLLPFSSSLVATLHRRRGFGRRDLGQLPLDEDTKLREIVAPETLERGQLVLDAADVRLRAREDPFGLHLRLAQRQLRLALGLDPHLGAELLRRDERLVDP